MRLKALAVPPFFRPPAWVKTPFRLIFLLTLAMILAVLVLYFRIQPQIPLFYSLAQPAQQLVAKEWLWLFPVTAVSITAVHLAVVQTYRNYNLLLIQLFSWTTVMILVLLGLALVRITMIVS
jgi:hypothetical protein